MKEMYPEKLPDTVWCEALMDIWLYRHLENKANKGK